MDNVTARRRYPLTRRAMRRARRERPSASASTPTMVRQIYADAFVLEAAEPPGWTAEHWARAMLEDAPLEVRAKLSSGWAALGLKAVDTDGSILGWQVLGRSPEVMALGRESRIGMPGQLLFVRRPEGLLFATFVRHRTVATRALWAAVEPTHVRTVRTLLERVGRRMGAPDVTAAGAE